MSQSKGTQEKLKNKVIDSYQSGQSCTAISKGLRLQRTVVRAVIHE